MAKRHKSEEPETEEEYQFIPPDFDEDHFIHKEMVSFHTTVVLFLAGIVAALASWAAFAAVDGTRTGWFLGLVIVAAAFAGLRPLFAALKIDIEHWARREWLGTAFLIFFTWLAFFIILVNPPVSDFAEPDLHVYTSPAAAAEGDTVVIDVFYTDNGAVAKRTFELQAPDGTTRSADDLVHVAGSHHRLSLDGVEAGTYTWSATATDKAGHQASINGTIEVDADVLDVTVGDLTRPTEEVFVRVPDELNLWAVYAQLESGDRVYLEYDDKVGGWIATANFEGWQEGNNTFDIVAQERNRFQGTTLVAGGTLRAGPFTVEVTEPGDYDDSLPKRANPTQAPSRNVPGPEVGLVLAGIVGVAFVARRLSR